MDEDYLPEFAGAYLEDSYFIGFAAEGKDLRLTCLLALTAEHPSYAPPQPGEHHCYRRGSIFIENPSIVDWRPGKPTITGDPDGSFDCGTIELYRCGPFRFRVVTQWFETTVDVKKLSIQLSEASV